MSSFFESPIFHDALTAYRRATDNAQAKANKMFDNDGILSHLGLARSTPATDNLLPALGLFGAGMAVGAITALLLAPRSGSDLRHDIGARATRLRRRVDPRVSSNYEDMTRDELYDQARSLGIDGRSEMNKEQLLEAVRNS